MSSSKKVFKIRKAQAWVACNKLRTIWTSGISTKTKINLLKLLLKAYFCMFQRHGLLLEKQLDGTYTRLVIRVQNINWKQQFTLEQIYGNLPKASDVIGMRRNYFTDHCLHAKEEMISYLFSPTSEKRKKAIQLSGNTCER